MKDGVLVSLDFSNFNILLDASRENMTPKNPGVG